MREFSQEVIKIVKKIPHGKTLTYKQVAKKAGNIKASRSVGNILNSYYKLCIKNGSQTVPCHRVVRSDGKPGGYVLGAKRKAIFLKKEAREVRAK
jgi:O-6-methylguanine DNA methyltransferase